MRCFKYLVFLSVSLTAAAATVDVWCDSPMAEVQPFSFGSGDEMNEEFLPLTGVSSLIGQTGIPMLRMGGIANEYYDWEGNNYNGTHYLDLVDTLIISQNTATSMDDFLQMCEENSIEPVLSVNFQLNDPEKAARFVEYCNGDQSTSMGQIRAQRGHPAPYNVTYWQIGNEPDVSGMLLNLSGYQFTLYRHFGIPFNQWHHTDSVFASSGEFAQLADTYADAMRAASPLPLEIATMSLAGDLSWLKETIEVCGANTDWVDVHYYPGGTWEEAQPDTTDYMVWLASVDSGPKAFDSWYQTMVDSVASFNGEVPLPVCVMEYNILLVYPDLTWWNYIDGLFIADCAGHLAEQGCPMGGVYSIFEGSATDPNTSFGMIRGDTLSMRATGHVMKLLNEQLTGTMLFSQSDVSGGGYGLDVHSSLRPDGKLCILLVNKHLTESFNTEVNLHGFSSSGYAEVWSIENDAPMEAPHNGTTGLQFKGNLWGTASTFIRTFPAASVTCLLVHPEGSGIEPGETGFSLRAAPNPASETVQIRLYIQKSSCVGLVLYDIAGRAVMELPGVTYSAGESTVNIDTQHLPDGIYILSGAFDGNETTTRLVITSNAP